LQLAGNGFQWIWSKLPCAMTPIGAMRVIASCGAARLETMSERDRQRGHGGAARRLQLSVNDVKAMFDRTLSDIKTARDFLIEPIPNPRPGR
jgi:hypothetical protein